MRSFPLKGNLSFETKSSLPISAVYSMFLLVISISYYVSSSYPGYDQEVIVQVNSVNVVYLDSFLQEVQKYFAEISEMQRQLTGKNFHQQINEKSFFSVI